MEARAGLRRVLVVAGDKVDRGPARDLGDEVSERLRLGVREVVFEAARSRKAYSVAPARITLDLDATDDPIHGRQERRFFHGYDDCCCYLPLYVFCGDHLLAAKLRRSNIDASAGATEEVARIVGRIRARWPRVKILLRADSGFAREALMAWCEANRVDFLFGLARNPRLVDRIYIDLAWAEDEVERTGRPARRFADFRWRTRESWSRRRRVVAKAEWMPGRGEAGANPRFVVTSLSATEIDARALYERLYCARGGSASPIAATHRDLRHDPPEAPEDRCAGDPQRSARPHRHGLRRLSNLTSGLSAAG